MWFVCQIETRRGSVCWRIKQATSFQACVRFYLTKHIYVYKIIPASEYIRRKLNVLKKHSEKNWEYFFEKLYSLLASGETLLTALIVLQEDKNVLQSFISKALLNLKNGLFIGSLWYQEDIPLTKGQKYLLQCAEQGGFLLQGLKQIKDALKLQTSVKKQIRRGLIYPGCVLCVMFCFMCVLSLFLLKNMEVFFYEQNIEPGWLESFMFSANHYFMPFFCGFLCINFFVFVFLKIKKVSLLDKFECWLEKRCRWLQYSIFSTNLAAFLENNFSMLESVKISLEHFVDKDMQNNVLLKINNGQTLSEALSFMPKDFYQAMKNGEISGDVVTVLKQRSQIYYQRHREKLSQWTKYIEPGCLILMAAFVLLLVIGMFFPMFQLFQSVSFE